MLALIVEALVYRSTDLLVALAPVAALALAAVFAVAAVAKAIDRTTTTKEFAAIGLPAPALLSRLVPPAELLVAVLVLFRPALGGLLATLALLAFSAVLLTAIRAGRTVSCGCLGPLSREPISVRTVARNGVLITLALLVSTGSTPDGFAPTLPAIEVLLSAGTSIVVAAVGLQLLATRNQIGRLWSVELAGDGVGGRRHRRRRTNDAHDSKNGAVS